MNQYMPLCQSIDSREVVIINKGRKSEYPDYIPFLKKIKQYALTQPTKIGAAGITPAGMQPSGSLT